MDDQRFDDRIRNKVGDYEDPGFDPAALVALHHQMATVSVVPWYSLYRTELLVGSGILLSTVIILWSQWIINTNATEVINEKIVTLQAQQAEIDRLQNQISLLKNVPDTIRIFEIREQPTDYSSLLYRIRLLEAEAAKRNVAGSSADSEIVSEGNNKSFSYDSKNILYNGQASTTGPFGNSFSLKLSPRAIERESLHAESNSEMKQSWLPAQGLSSKTIRDIEKHYQRGIGIRVGPVVELVKGNYTVGESDASIAYGVLGDFIFSPSWSLEMGVKYTKRYYEISDNQELITYPLPGVDETIGTLKKAEIDSWMFEFPVALKYRYPLSMKTHIQSGLGYSALLYHQQIFEYDYSFTGGGDAVTLGSAYESNEVSFYPGSINLSIGIGRQLKNRKILETSLYYQYGLGKKGIEEINGNFLGIRGVYWFTIR